MYLMPFEFEIDGEIRKFHVTVEHVTATDKAKVVVFIDQEYLEYSRMFNYAIVDGYEKIGYDRGYYIHGLGQTSETLKEFMNQYISVVRGNEKRWISCGESHPSINGGIWVKHIDAERFEVIKVDSYMDFEEGEYEHIFYKGEVDIEQVSAEDKKSIGEIFCWDEKTTDTFKVIDIVSHQGCTRVDSAKHLNKSGLLDYSKKYNINIFV